jgi:DNA repair photolyase
MMKKQRQKAPGRGTAWNPPNRFESQEYVQDLVDTFDTEEAGTSKPETRFLKDHSKTLITYNDSPDVGFDASVNPYRGCEHGCAYCYARPTHEYLGYSAGLDFETKIMVKEEAPALLRQELSSRRWKPQVIALSGVTDPYQPVEKRLRLTRGCLEVLCQFSNPVTVITKNYLVTRDIDLLQQLASKKSAAVSLSITTLSDDVTQLLEPRTSRPYLRLKAIERLSTAGIPTGIMVAPIIPGLTDHEIPSILASAAQAGARFAGTIALRLPATVAPLFEEWLSRCLPDRKEKIINRIKSMRQGKLYDSRYGSRMRGEGIFSEQMATLFAVACRKAGLSPSGPKLSSASFHRPQQAQLSLFE